MSVAYLTTFAQMRRLDEAAIQEHKIPGLALMENAGRAAAEVARGMLADAGKTGCATVAVLAGPGNNGGDGYVVARHLHGWGERCVVYLLAPEAKVAGDARTNLEAWRGLGGIVVDATAPGALALLLDSLREADLVVDALFGTGLAQEVRSPYREAIDVINGLGRPVLALDIASGLCGDRGRVLGVAVRASATVTFGFAKRGHYLYPGAAHTGALHVVDIGIPDTVTAAHQPTCSLMRAEDAQLLLPRRARDAHKGTFGHVLVLAGGAGRTGAALLAARAAYRSGAGLVTIAAPQSSRGTLDAKVVEVMTESVGDTLDRAAAGRILELCAGKDALVLGPGLGTGRDVAGLLRALLPALDCPTVLDADALTVLADDLGLFADTHAPLLLTPHPGEMARLAALTTAEIQGDRLGHAEGFARTHGVTLVLKGAGTVVAEPSGRLWLNTSGNPGMATGGAGDVLCGVLAALLAAKLPSAEAARLGVYAHGAAGDLARETQGEMGLIAGDLVEALPRVWQGLGR